MGIKVQTSKILIYHSKKLAENIDKSRNRVYAY